LIGLLGSLWIIQHALIVVPVLITLALPAIAALCPDDPTTRRPNRALLRLAKDVDRRKPGGC
jgi:hypothetical protein